MRLGKTVKTRTSTRQQVLERHMIGLVQWIALDQARCVGCRDCQVICPTEAITSSDPVLCAGSLQAPIAVDINPDLCHFCGQCALVCPVKAVSWRKNDNTVPDLVLQAVFPALQEEIDIHLERCQADCRLVCQPACPVDAIRVETHHPAGAPQAEIVAVDVDRARCFFCHKCEAACPYGAIAVVSARDGMVIFSPADCPDGCHACTEICPSGALHLENGRVELEETLCIYCRACQNVCPTPQALEIRREKIRHQPVRSRLWDEIQARLISESARLRFLEESGSAKRERAFRTRID